MGLMEKLGGISHVINWDLAMDHHLTTELNWSACLETPANLFSLRKPTVCTSNKRPFFTPHQTLQGKDQETQEYETIIKYNGLMNGIQ